MRAMRKLAGCLVMMWFAAGARAQVTEQEFRQSLGVGAAVQLQFRDGECKAIGFADFAQAMQQPQWGSQLEHAPDGASVTVTLHRRGYRNCPSPYPPVTAMPSFDLPDLQGKRVTSASLVGKPTLMNFYFATCVPCILEVGPLNTYAASRKDMNFIAVTFDEPAEARAFVQRFGFRWRVVPDARDFIDRMRVKNYPQMALFDAQGRLLGVKPGGAKDELEAATVLPQLKRWVDGLLPPKAGG
jgi:cytochrome oxidase Cu insertion factor (SCO1/SenC/PrrC family)